MRGWLAGSGGKAALIAAGCLLIAILVIPLTRTALLESVSVHFGGWSYSDNGPYDAGTWGPVEQPSEAIGADGALIEMFSNDNAAYDESFVNRHPYDLRIRSLYIGKILQFKGLPLEPDASPERIRKYEAAMSKLKSLVPIIEQAESQDEENAFFPLAKAVALEYLEDRPAAISALRQALSLPNYNDYWHESYSLYAAQQSGLLYRVRPVFSDSIHLDELNRFAARLAKSSGAGAIEIRGLLLNCLAKSAAGAQTSGELEAITRSLQSSIVPSYTSLRSTLGRSPNQGDIFRELVRFQDSLRRSGFKLDYELSAFYGSEPGRSFFDGSIFTEFFGDSWHEALDITYTFYDNAVVTTLLILEAVVGIAVFGIVLLPIRRLKSLTVPPIGIPAMIAIVASAAAAVSEGYISSPMFFVATCYVLAFVLSFNEKPRWVSLAAGLFTTICAFSFLAITEGSENYLVPAVAYSICLPLYARAWKWRIDKGWIFPALAVAAAGLAVTGSIPEPFLDRAMHFATVALFAIFGVSLWFRCEVFEASKRLLRSMPFAVLLSMIALLISVAWQAFLTHEIDLQISGEAEYTQRWKSNIREIVRSP